MKLSILICSVPSRVKEYFPKLMEKLEPQLTKDVEVLWLGDNKKRSVGQKRNDLLALAQGQYVTYVDDDDDISEDYVKEILHYIKHGGGVDVINFNVMCSVNGGDYKRVDYDARFKRDTDHADHYRRIPNHIMCIRKDLARQVGFPHKNMSEDSDFAKKLRPLIRSQAFIEKPLYYYTFSHQVSETQ